MCGPRNAAFDAFRTSIHQRPEALHVLLVDSEDAVRTSPWKHLQTRGEWQGDVVHDEHCHFMAQTMESWFVADPGTLANFYGPNFNANLIPKNQDVEQISKNQVETILKIATNRTQKGEYHKIRHAYKLLAVIDVATVRHAARHCERLFATLISKLA